MSARRLGLEMLPDWPRYLSVSLASAYLGVCPSLFLAEVKSGMWPKPSRRGKSGGLPTWDRALLDQAADRLSGLNGPVQPVASDENEMIARMERRVQERLAQDKAKKEAQLEEWRLKREAKQRDKDERQKARETRRALREQEKAEALARRAEREAQRLLLPPSQQAAIVGRERLYRSALAAKRLEPRPTKETREQVRERWTAAAKDEETDVAARPDP